MLQAIMLGLLFIQAASAGRQLWLSPVNIGDCVAARITAPRTRSVDQFYKKYCSEANTNAAAARKCIENTAQINEIYFFTDRCSGEDYYIGINGKELRLKRVTKKPGKPHSFVGSFAGEGLTVQISQARLIEKTYIPGEPRTEDNVLDVVYKVLVTVTKGNAKKTFNGILLDGR